ncbi:hypothetical protein [Corynebacterium pseudopelargi]|uniref:Primosomal protein n=1 Tax=Corynebacterium pseudopelargi TaxID=2080757 RepID=A0A3G6IVR5_9CORY|nr:hypothetical protein [Corynebacterium pseudopelargi]AZA09871.1 hypothetical protein CPPEL_08840 [Corynebacterium pseudopelargi]
MATNGIVPVQLSLTEGDVYTLWAPSWREHGNEWQAFLGQGDQLLVFGSTGELLAFIEEEPHHDFSHHPQWEAFRQQALNKVTPTPRHCYDLVGMPAALADRPSHRNVSEVARCFHIVRSLGTVLDLAQVREFFGNYMVLQNVERGAEHLQADPVLWTNIGRAVLDRWDGIIDAIDAAVTLRHIDAGDAQARIDAALSAKKEEEAQAKAAEQEAKEQADPYDLTAWAAAGIDPIKVAIEGRQVYSLRTYVAGQPVFLGRFGEINTFTSSKAMLRWLAEHDEHDLAKVSTWEDLMVRINAGELEVEVHPDNVYSFNGIARDINTGIEAVDTEQMARAYELMADAADWAQDDSLNSYFLANPRIQDYLSYMLGKNRVSGYTPTPPFDEHAQSWRELESMLSKRMSK